MKFKHRAALLLAAGLLSILYVRAASSKTGLVVHEWGTFTSFQGSDGNLMSWQPLQTSPLPAFVYNWSRPGFNSSNSGLPGVGGKYTLFAKQRLETPVVYFYSEKAQTIDCRVKFPDGWITEWYPRAERVSHLTNEGEIRWPGLNVLTDSTNVLASHPTTREDHYFAARQTDSDFVQTAAPNETEKFLFYRGAGNFATPLRVTMESDDRVKIENSGLLPLSHLFILQLKDKAGDFVYLPLLKAGENKTLRVPLKKDFLPGPILSRKISARMAKSLVKSGLYPREAEAMVNTWDDSWFQENGLRVLYVLPQKWTEHALPMMVQPAPQELIRVMVGRAEVLTPATEQTLIRQLTSALEGDKQGAKQAHEILRNLGRFSEPALNRVMTLAKFTDPQRGKLYTLLYSPAAFE